MVEREESDITYLGTQEAVEKAVRGMLVCEVCERQNRADEIDHTTTDDGVYVEATFECAACGAHNESEVCLS